VTSRNFELSHLYSKPNPFVVLEKSDDGDARAKALRALREPKQSGGTDHDQDAVVKILCTAATKEKQFLCRMAAIESLGHFKDPRAVAGLTDAFYASGSFAPDLATRIQMQAVTALGETRQPGAVPFLVKIVQEKPKGEGSEQEKQQIMDVRIAATRALGNFNDPRSTEVLQEVLKTEKDVALQDCAKDSLALAGGKKGLLNFKWEDVIVPVKALLPTDNSGAMPTPPVTNETPAKPKSPGVF
jgi:HEAT repeat protein